MQRAEISPTQVRKRKMLLVLPLLVVPFLTLLFWTLGGGKGSKTVEHRTDGINPNLPGAALKEEKGWDKLSFYDLAQKDSLKLDQQLKGDSYWKVEDTGQVGAPSTETFSPAALERYSLPVSEGLRTSPNNGRSERPEDALLKKLEVLQKSLADSEMAEGKRLVQQKQTSVTASPLTGEVDRLMEMMQEMTASNGEDPEMAQVQATLEKLLDVQHPERVRERLKEQSVRDKRIVLDVTSHRRGAGYSLLDTPKHKTHVSGFYGLAKDNGEIESSNTLTAVVQGTQTLTDGSVIRMRLNQDLFVAGVRLPKGTPIFGEASLHGERLQIAVTSLRYGASLMPVNLLVHDLDGLAGIAIPGAITRETAKESVSDATQLIGLTSLDPSLKAQVATAGLDAAKKLISKKTRLVKVTVKSGYQVLLKEQKNF